MKALHMLLVTIVMTVAAFGQPPCTNNPSTANLPCVWFPQPNSLPKPSLPPVPTYEVPNTTLPPSNVYIPRPTPAPTYIPAPTYAPAAAPNVPTYSAAQAAQAERDRQSEELGKSMGNAMGGLVGLAIRKHAIAKQYKAYCNQHPGESWARRNAKGTVLDQGTCPGTLTRQQVIADLNRGFQAQGVVGYTEVSGDTFIMHSERASAMRFHMVLDREMLEVFQTTGIKTFVYTNDNDQRYVYDVGAGHEVTPDVPAAVPAAAPAPPPSATTEAEPLANAASSGTVKNVVLSAPSPSTPAVTPAVSVAVPTKPCNNAFRDRAGHEVCLDQH